MTETENTAEDAELVHECELEDLDEIKRRGLHGSIHSLRTCTIY